MLRIERNEKDGDMLNLYSIVKDKYILWAIAHSDVLSELNTTTDHLDNDDIHLIINTKQY